MRKYYMLMLLVTVVILACNEQKQENAGTTTQTAQKKKTKKFDKERDLKVIDEVELVKALDIDLPSGLLFTGANNLGNVYHSQFESTKTMNELTKEFKTMLDAKMGATFLRVESTNKKFAPWEERTSGSTTLRNAVYIYNDGQHALNIKLATSEKRDGVLVYLGKAKIY